MNRRKSSPRPAPSARISGLPDWAKTARYAIDAEPPAGTPTLTGSKNMQRFRIMLQALLADRFQLVTHRASRRMPVYELVTAKSGSKFPPPSPPGQPPPTVGIMNPKNPKFTPQPGPGEISMGIAGIPGLVAALGMHLGRPVVDKTGISGDYDIHLVWQPRPGEPAARYAKPKPAGSNGPSLLTALNDQLGLQVRAATDPVNIVVIDHIARPSANWVRRPGPHLDGACSYRQGAARQQQACWCRRVRPARSKRLGTVHDQAGYRGSNGSHFYFTDALVKDEPAVPPVLAA